ncbi:zf-u1 domain-containing protein [Phaffia rhodozyma]|uniref:Zf-u1 domain-containing protein n=1 Tax=Phaffia rhodozyma TaxID=264483 RepID=A0A0F7SXS8_PHARH|nr:zf-u1 domain-containing protein [Phaffia rhodozyma]
MTDFWCGFNYVYINTAAGKVPAQDNDVQKKLTVPFLSLIHNRFSRKATKKHYCKYCDLHINDDAPSKQLHESGLRHLGNKERALREIYKSGEKMKKAKDEEAKEIAKIEKAAAEAHALDSGIPLVSSTAGGDSKKTERPSKYDSYTTAADLGYEDPNAHLVAEKALRQTEGRSGSGTSRTGASTGVFGLSARKREEAEEEENGRNFKFRRREKRPVAYVDEDDDLGEIKVKVKEEERSLLDKQKEHEAAEAKRKEKLVWQPVGWGTRLVDEKEAKTQIKEEVKQEDEGDGSSSVKATSFVASSSFGLPLVSHSIKTDEDVKLDIAKIEAEEPSIPPPSTGGMFKKRRGPPKGVGKIVKP